MAELSPAQRQTRARVERMIRLMAPALDLVLAVGDRVSRAAEPEDHEYYPARMPRPARPPTPSRRPGGTSS